MFKDILVPLDGSRFAEFALPAALGIAERSGGRIRLLSAVTEVPPVPFVEGEDGAVKGWFAEARSRTAQYLEDVGERLQEAGLSAEPETKVLVGPAVRMLAKEIETTHPDLVVMTTHGRGRLERAWVGSVTDGLLRRSASPLLLVRPEKDGEVDLGRTPAFQDILVPLDGSETAEAILGPAEELASLYESRLSLVAVLPHPFPMSSTYLPHVVGEAYDAEEQKKSFRSYLEGVRGRVNKVERVTVREAEDAARGILEEVRDSSADLVAMSSHGRSGVARVVLGSVTDKVIRGAELPILVCRIIEED